MNHTLLSTLRWVGGGMLLMALLSGCGSSDPVRVAAPQEPQLAKPQPVASHLNEVSQMLADQLVRNTDIDQFSQAPVAITSFVNLENFEESSRLGEIIAQNMVHELQVRGHQVIDFKMTPHIRVTPEGDFVMSRDIDELVARRNIDVVLTGTYVVHSDGVTLNARLVEFESGVVLSSAQASIPGWTVYAVEPPMVSQGQPMVEMSTEVAVDDPLPIETETITAMSAGGFSGELDALDQVLFGNAEVATLGATVVTSYSEREAAMRRQMSRYLCLEDGVCFDNGKKGTVTPSPEE